MLKKGKRLVRGVVITLNTAVAFVMLLAVNLYVALPYRTILYEGDEYVYSIASSLGLRDSNVWGNVKKASANISLKDDLVVSYSEPGVYQVDVTALGAIPIKTMEVSVIPKATLVPIGASVGVEIKTEGVLVVSVSDIIGYDGTAFSPAEDAGIKAGDIISKINGVDLSGTDELAKILEASDGSAMQFTILRGGDEITVEAAPKPDSTTGRYKLGLWVRDGTTGIGTITFYDTATHKYAALGHGISDSDTGAMLSVSEGRLTEAGIVGVNKGEKGAPGELKGYIMADRVLGDVTVNNEFGIYGNLSAIPQSGMPAMPSAERDEITEGAAWIMCCINGQNTEKYQVEIERVFRHSADTNKGMIVRITDPKLLSTTGGIVQGMSGSPIIQDGKLVGAVTHVFVNDPTRGYGIFIDNMLAEAEKVN